MKGVVTLQQSRHCAASSSTAAVAALPALRILCLFAVRTLPVCGSQLPRISQAELLSVIRSTLCRRTMMSLPYGDVF